MENEKSPKLFIVFSPEGPTAPVKTHPSHREAAAIAWHMAKLHPGQTFFVMKTAGRRAFIEAPANETAPALAAAE
jgi:hypothetical protein